MFSRSDFEVLNSLLETLEGRFIMTINDRLEVRAIFKQFAFREEDVKYTLSSNNGHTAKELIITNF